MTTLQCFSDMSAGWLNCSRISLSSCSYRECDLHNSEGGVWIGKDVVAESGGHLGSVRLFSSRYACNLVLQRL